MFNNYVTLSCLYAKFRSLISHIQLSFQALHLSHSTDWQIAEGIQWGQCRFNPYGHRRVAEMWEVFPISWLYVMIEWKPNQRMLGNHGEIVIPCTRCIIHTDLVFMTRYVLLFNCCEKKRILREKAFIFLMLTSGSTSEN